MRRTANFAELRLFFGESAHPALRSVVGMVVAAPLLSAAVRISADLAAGRKRAEAEARVSDRSEPRPLDPQPGRS